jgi:hypothetical protein
MGPYRPRGFPGCAGSGNRCPNCLRDEGCNTGGIVKSAARELSKIVGNGGMLAQLKEFTAEARPDRRRPGADQEYV